MKVILLISCIFILGCKASKQITGNEQLLSLHPRPIKVFGVGYANPGYNVLTLTDAEGAYFVIKTPINTALKVGDTYMP